MNTVFFFYTLAILVVCIVSSVLSAAAWASSRRRIFVYGAIAFACYAIEMTEIFFNEYISQNIAFPASDYYDIAMPFERTFVVTVLQANIWLIALDILDRTSKRRFFWPVLAFLISNIVIIVAMPEGPWRQWAYYTTRQVFSFFVYAYAAWCYLRSDDERYRARLGKLKAPFLIMVVLTTCVLLEDIYIILIAPMNTHVSWLPLYLSERNFSENVLLCFMAFVLVHVAYNVLSIRIKEAPVQEEVGDLDRHIDEQMPFFRETHKLSKREAEVLKLVLLGKNNQEIANELYLAVGTVKAHVHNIMKKCGKSSREELTLFFWKS